MTMITPDSTSEITNPNETNMAQQFTLLDLLLVIVENLRLLILGPLVAGLVAFGGATLMPKTYESTAILKAEQSTATLMNSASVLDSIAVSLGYTKRLDMDEARLNLQKEIHIHLNAKDKLLHLTAQAETPQAAQTLAQAILNQTFTNSQPRDSEKMRLQKQLEQAQTREKMAQQSADVMGKKLESITTGGSSEVAQGYAQMIRVVQESQAAQNDIERQLNGLDSSELVQEPTLPTKHKEIKRGLISFLAMQFVLFIIFLKITTSIAIKNSAENIDNIKKIENIKNTFKKSIYFWKI
jgi:uncharacterized protein involved in exopolysaccharide biosynthesis